LQKIYSPKPPRGSATLGITYFWGSNQVQNLYEYSRVSYHSINKKICTKSSCEALKIACLWPHFTTFDPDYQTFPSPRVQSVGIWQFCCIGGFQCPWLQVCSLNHQKAYPQNYNRSRRSVTLFGRIWGSRKNCLVLGRYLVFPPKVNCAMD
jgi:hypothetical protein